VTALVCDAFAYARSVKQKADVVGAGLARLHPLQQDFASAGLVDAVRIAHSGQLRALLVAGGSSSKPWNRSSIRPKLIGETIYSLE